LIKIGGRCGGHGGAKRTRKTVRVRCHELGKVRRSQSRPSALFFPSRDGDKFSNNGRDLQSTMTGEKHARNKRALVTFYLDF
jgi:hypothetical protein